MIPRLPSGVLRGNLGDAVCRLDLNDPPTAVGGIEEMFQVTYL